MINSFESSSLQCNLQMLQDRAQIYLRIRRGRVYSAKSLQRYQFSKRKSQEEDCLERDKLKNCGDFLSSSLARRQKHPREKTISYKQQQPKIDSKLNNLLKKVNLSNSWLNYVKQKNTALLFHNKVLANALQIQRYEQQLKNNSKNQTIREMITCRKNRNKIGEPLIGKCGTRFKRDKIQEINSLSFSSICMTMVQMRNQMGLKGRKNKIRKQSQP